MIKRFEVKNYKNFQDSIVFDFARTGNYEFNTDCIHENKIGVSIVYGANATGKTNLCRAIMDITWILAPIRRVVNSNVVNANSDEKTAQFIYDFCFGKDEIEYIYSRDSQNLLVNEKLIINADMIYDLDYSINDFKFINLSALGAETIQKDKYLELHKEGLAQQNPEKAIQIPFLRYLLANASLLPKSPIRKLETFVMNMRSLSGVSFDSELNRQRLENFFETLGTNGELKKFEKFLNQFGVECKLVIKKRPDGKNQLYFKHKRPILFVDNASSGTIALTKIYMSVFRGDNIDSFLYLDEFDAFYHYEMAEQMVDFLKKNYKDTQIVLTTHNTNLMSNQIMRPDCLFILSRDGRLTALCDATERELKEGHNLEKLYISGEFRKYE